VPAALTTTNASGERSREAANIFIVTEGNAVNMSSLTVLVVKNPTENISSEFLRNEVEERVKTVFIKFFFSAMEYLKGRDIVPIRVREKRICQAIFRAFESPVQSPGNYLLIRDYAILGDLQTVV
jgi:hypothetical protein